MKTPNHKKKDVWMCRCLLIHFFWTDLFLCVVNEFLKEEEIKSLFDEED